MKARAYWFIVQGRGRFPLDMLRYDRCLPVDPEGVANMEPGALELRTVTLEHLTERRGWEPTAARWSSFGWSVISCREMR